tara:strand:- start:110 stop:466 length:357 start_codon:yes stop_codon:yes gene_type:complete
MENRPILGLTEKVTIIGNNGKEEKLIARIDTGATSSSVDTRIAEMLELGPVIREKTVKSASGITKRPIVVVKVKVDGTTLEEEFTLADRTHMTYPALLGQNILKKGQFLIDPLRRVEE